MKLKEHFEVGQLVEDTLAGYKCIIRGIERDFLLLSRLERPDVKYIQVPRYLKEG